MFHASSSAIRRRNGSRSPKQQYGHGAHVSHMEALGLQSGVQGSARFRRILWRNQRRLSQPFERRAKKVQLAHTMQMRLPRLTIRLSLIKGLCRVENVLPELH